MSRKAVVFDNEYVCYIDGKYVANPNGECIASLHDIDNLSEMSDIELLMMCSPIFQAYEKGIRETKTKFTKQLLQLFDLREDKL